MKNTMIVLIAALMISHVSFAAAEENKGENQKHFRQRIEKMMEELNLTPEQREQIKEQRSQYRGTSKELRSLLRKKEKDLKDEFEKESTDKEKVKYIAGDIKELQAKLIDQRIQSILAMKETLTPQQYKIFHEKTRELMRKRRGKNKDFRAVQKGD